MTDFQIVLQVVQVIAYIIAAAIFVIMLKADLRVLANNMKAELLVLSNNVKAEMLVVTHDVNVVKLRQDSQSDNIKQLTAVLTTVAVQNTRLTSIEEDIREIKHGKGFVQRELTGEWVRDGKVEKVP